MTELDETPWSDSPRSKADISGRPAFAEAVAARIGATPVGTSSTVYGLVGPWGSGKTTLLHDIEERLTWQTVWFSPWSAADVTAITGEFVAALSEAFPQAKTLKSRLLGYARFGVPALKAVPFAGEAAAGIAATALDNLATMPAWHTEFQTISQEIAEQSKRVLVMVDDVDRLDATELRALLRVIRLLGRFNNVHYLIAYDQATIDLLLEGSDLAGAGHSSDFMEKIVQYPFEVPPTPAIERRRWARDLLRVAVPQQAQVSDYLRVPTEDLIGILAAGIETPRAAERLREQLTSFAELATQAELDGLDFVTISWLRIAHHNVWDHIRTRPEEYQAWNDTDTDKVQSERKANIAKLVQRGGVEPVWDAVQFLFGNSSGTSVAVRKSRMCEARYFNRYFLLGLADDDVSDAKTQAAIDQIIAGIATSGEICAFTDLILGVDGERASLALQVGRASRGDETASVALVDYLYARRSDLQENGRLQDFRQAPLERWLAREIALALSVSALSVIDAAEQFGYEFLIASAYGVRRSGPRDDELIRAAFGGVTETWMETVKGQTLDQVLARSELFPMLSLCVWLGANTGAGILAPLIASTDDLIRAAQRFVTYKGWIGSFVEYEVEFGEAEFRFAVGSALTTERQSELPAPDKDLHYEVVDRPTRDLDPIELRDYSVRKLRELAL